MSKLVSKIIVTTALAALCAVPLSAACNCWDGDLICTYYTPDGRYAGWAFMQNAAYCN